MIYLFNNNEEMIRIIPNSAIKRMYQTQTLTDENYISDRLDVEMQALNDEELSELEYMAIDDIENPQRFHYYFIVKETTEHQVTSLTGVQSGIEELRKTPVYDMRPTNLSPKLIADRLLEGTNWQAGYTTDDVGTISTNFYYTDVFSALKKMCMAFGIEMQFFVEITTNRIGARYIEFRKRTGKSVGKRVVYGHNALKIVKEVEKTNTVTALIGRGKGVQVSESDEGNIGYGRKIGIENVEWKISSGAPVDKPLGQKFVEIPELTLQYGIKNSNGTVRPKIGFVEFQDEESETRLIDRTYNALLELSRPQVLLETSSVYLPDTGIGDTINVVRHDRDLRYQTRVFEITWDRLANQAVDMKLGDRLGESENKRISNISNQISGNISTELGSTIEELVDRVTTADGKNTNWYTDYDPMENPETMGLVRVNDNWWQPDPEYEGEFILKQWNGEMWVEILRTSGNPELVRRFEEIEQQAQGLADEIEASDQKAVEALEKAGANASLLTTHQSTLNTINTVTLPDITSTAGTALANAKDAMAEAKKADEKIADYVSTNGLVSGTTVDSKIDTVAGVISERITTLETNKLDSTTYTDFYDNEYVKTAQGVTDAWTAVNKIVDEDGNTTDTFAKAVYDKNATRQSADFNEVTKDLVKQNTFTAGINGLSGSISTLSGQLDKLKAGGGGRNYALKSNAYYYTTDYKVSEYDLTKILKGTKIKISIWGALSTDVRTFRVYINNSSGTGSGNSQIIELTKLDGIHGQGVSAPLSKWTAEVTLGVDATKILIFGADNNSSSPKRVEYVKVETGETYTDWTIAPEDTLGKADFQVFKTTYEANDKAIKARLLAVDSGEKGSIAYRLNETEKTASGNTTTIANIKTKPGEQITGYQTIKERSELYERVIGTDEASIKSNMARMVMTDSLFRTEVIKNVPSDIGGRNYVLKSDEYYYTNNYKVAEYDLSTIPKNTKIKISLWGGLATTVRTFGVYVNNASGTTSGNSQLIELNKLDGVFGQGLSVPLAKWTAEATLNVEAKKILIYGLDNNHVAPKRVEYVQIETGDYFTDWTAAPEDKANRSQVTQLADSWALTLKSGNDIKTQINATTNGIRLASKLIHLSGTSLIDDAVIKSAMIDTLDASKITTGELNASLIRVVNLDASSISGNEANFIRAMFSGAYSTLQITGNGINILDNAGRTATHFDNRGIEFYEEGTKLGNLEYVRNASDSGAYYGFNGISFRPERDSYFGVSYFPAGSSTSIRRFSVSGDTGRVYMQNLYPSEGSSHGLEFVRLTLSEEPGTVVRNTANNSGIFFGDYGRLSFLENGTWTPSPV